MRSKAFSMVLLCASLGCGVKTEKSADTSAADTTVRVSGTMDTNAAAPAQAPPSTGTATNQQPPASAPAPAVVSPPTQMFVTEYGIGPIRTGMTVAQAAKAVGGGFGPPPGGSSGCGYAVLTKAPEGVAIMIQNGKVVRVEVRSGPIPTSLGARIGNSETRIKSLYAGRVVSTPHKYVPDGHYLTVTPTDNSANRIVFETDGQQVTEYRAGQLPAVEYVERCG
jgi:hypothetical protein